MREERPTPLDEVRSGLIVFEQSLWDALPRYLRSVDRALAAAPDEDCRSTSTPIRFGSWIGGDRDGNPNVTPEVTRHACLLSRWVAADLYLKEIRCACATSCRWSRRHPSCARGPAARASHTARCCDGALAAARDARLDRARRSGPMTTIRPGADVYLDADDLTAALALVPHVARGDRQRPHRRRPADRLSDESAAFGLTLARLDIRQDAARHTEALAAMTSALGLGSYGTGTKRRAWISCCASLPARRPLIPRDLEASPEVRDVLDTFRMIARTPQDRSAPT